MNKALKSRLEKAGKIVIGLSGGADSVVLTHILFVHFGADKLIAAHVNHGIRGAESDHDEAFVTAFCNTHSIHLEILRANVPATAAALSLGTEECGRKLRYDFFESLCVDESDVITTAHNADDNAETVLMNLIRGTGISGLCGIPTERGRILRPILTMSRGEIENYCATQGLSFVTDSTNFQNEYTRNKIRNTVLPLLREINPCTVAHINDASAIMKENADYLSLVVAELLEKAQTPAGLNMAVLANEPDFIMRELLLRYLKQQGCMQPQHKHLKSLCKAVRESGSVSLPGKWQATVRQNMLVVTRGERPPITQVSLNIDGETLFGEKKLVIYKKNLNKELKINNLLFNNSLDCARIKGVLTVGPRNMGEKFSPAGRGVRKSLKKLFSEMRIPEKQRNEIAVIRDGENVVFVEGVGVSEDYRPTAESKDILVVKIMQMGDEYGGQYDE